VLGAYPPDRSAKKPKKMVTRWAFQVRRAVMATCIDSPGVTYKRGRRNRKAGRQNVLGVRCGVTTTFGKKLDERTKQKTDRSLVFASMVRPDLTIPNYSEILWSAISRPHK